MTPGKIVARAVDICALENCGLDVDQDKPICRWHRERLSRPLLVFLMGTWNSYLADPLAYEPLRAHQKALREANAFFSKREQ